MDCTQWKSQIEKAVNACGRRLPAEQRDDLRQDCYLALVEKADKVDAIVAAQGQDSGGKYVYRIAVNRCLSTLRKNKRREKVFAEVGAYVTTPLEESWDGEETDEQPMNGELARIAQYGVSNTMLEEAIGRLDIEEQHVIRELFYEGVSERAAGRQVGHSHTWTRRRKKLALAHLREQLGSTKEQA